MTEKRMLYKERDLLQFPVHYTDHLGAMTWEGLHDKSDIAGQLAWRDWLLSNVVLVLQRIHAQCANPPEKYQGQPEVVAALGLVADDLADNVLDQLAERYPELPVVRESVGRWASSTPNILNIPSTTAKTGRLSSAAPNLSNYPKTAGKRTCGACQGKKTVWGGSFYEACLTCLGTGELPVTLAPTFDTTPPECVPKGARWAQWIVDAGAGTIIATLWVEGERVVSNMMKPWPPETDTELSPSYAAFCAALYHGHVGKVD